MGIYRIGEPFKNVQEFADYPHNKLYFHGKLIGKPIVDNWQFRLIQGSIENGALLKAELSDGYKYYYADVEIFDNDSELSFCRNLDVIARNSLEAKCKVILKIINEYNMTDEDIDIRVDVYTLEVARDND